MDSKKYFVGGIPFAVNGDALRDFFERAVGPVKFAVVSYEKDTGRHRGFGFVQFHSHFADRRMPEMNGAKLGERRITVREAQER